MYPHVCAKGFLKERLWGGVFGAALGGHICITGCWPPHSVCSGSSGVHKFLSWRKSAYRMDLFQARQLSAGASALGGCGEQEGDSLGPPSLRSADGRGTPMQKNSTDQSLRVSPQQVVPE